LLPRFCLHQQAKANYIQLAADVNTLFEIC
jgi:hypothetical protein